MYSYNFPKIMENVTFSLNDQDRIWTVESGNVDVFIARKIDENSWGHRIHLFRLNQGEILFGHSSMPNREFELIAVTLNDSRVRVNNLANFYQTKDINNLPIPEEKFISSIGRWISLLANVSFSNSILATKTLFEDLSQTEVILQKKECYKLPQKLFIARACNGAVRILSKTPVIIPNNINFPIIFPMKIMSEEDSSIVLMNGKEWILSNEFCDSLDAFYNVAFSCLQQIIQAEDINRTSEISRETKVFEAMTASALNKLVAVLDKNEVEDDDLSFLNEPLLKACQAVSKAQGFSISTEYFSKQALRDSIKSKNPFQNLDRVANIVGFKTRTATLKSHWWEKDCGSLLGFVGDELQPCALLRGNNGKYQIHNFYDDTIKTVDEEISQKLLKTVFYIYRPAKTKMNWKTLISFGSFNAGSDLVSIIWLLLLIALLGIITPVATGIIFNVVIPNKSFSLLYQIIIVLIISFIASTIFKIAKMIILLRFNIKITNVIQPALWDKILRLPIHFFKKYTVGDLTNRIMGIEAIRAALSDTFISGIISVIFASINIILMFYYNSRLAGFAVVFSLIFSCIFIAIDLLTLKYQRRASFLDGKITGIIRQAITNIEKLRGNSCEERLFGEWAKQFAEQTQASITTQKISAFSNTISLIIPAIANMFFYMIVAGESSWILVGSLMAFMSAFTLFFSEVLWLAKAAGAIISIIPSYERLKPILDAEVEEVESKILIEKLSGEIKVENITFQYSDNSPVVLHDVSLAVSPGEFVAIVGPSGSGKSTLLRLLLGFDEPKNGHIFYDHYDLSKLDVGSVRRQIGVVMQTSALISGTIFENISSSSTSISMDDALAASRLAGLDEFIQSLPMTMHTMVMEGAGMFSGGQKQQIMIARAIARKPLILFLDEASSALDNLTQQVVMNHLEQLKMTRIVIAHRLSTIINADKIYVLENGRIVQCGNYKTLMLDKKGTFAKLAKRQIVQKETSFLL